MSNPRSSDGSGGSLPVERKGEAPDLGTRSVAAVPGNQGPSVGTDGNHLERLWCIGFFVVCLLLNLALSCVGLNNSLNEIHEFRQHQTALNARGLMEEGWSLAYPAPLFGPPWSVPMEFPLYQFVTAKVASVTNLPLEVVGRLVALSFLYLSLPACFALAGCLGLSRERQWLAPALVLLTPVYIYYSRSFMIESTALCAAVWFLLGYIRVLATGSRKWLFVGIICGMAAALVKVTTASVFLIVAAAYTGWLLWSRWRNRSPGAWSLVGRAIIMVVPIIAAGAVWVHFSDAVKSSNPLSAYLVSANMRQFNFGTLAQRFTSEFWHRLAGNTQWALAPLFNVHLILLFTVFLGKGRRTRSLLLLVGFLAGPLTFANLYFVHEYYFFANGVFLVGALALAWDRVLDLTQFSHRSRWAIIVISAAAQLFPYFNSYFPVQRKPLAPIPELASILSLATRKDDVVMIFGQDWSARVPYYAHRKAVMIPDVQADRSDAINAVLDRLEPGRVTAMVLSGPFRKRPEALRSYMERLALRPDPILINDDSLVYVAESRLSEALTALEKAPPKTFEFPAPAADSTSSTPRHRVLGASITDRTVIAMMTPPPIEIRYPFKLEVYELPDRKVFNAHSPTDILFGITPSATEVHAEFGILEEAYTGKNHTDGVEFRVELVAPDGTHQILHTVYLNPSPNLDDRGQKTIALRLPTDAAGQIWFRTLPSPNGSIAFGWAYWAKIEIR